MLAVYSPSVPGAVPQKMDTMVSQTKWELLPIRTGVVVKSIKLLETMRSGYQDYSADQVINGLTIWFGN